MNGLTWCRTYRGRTHHIVRQPEQTETLCGLPMDSMVGIWPASMSPRVDYCPTCPSCDVIAALAPGLITKPVTR